jgi:hypothetical protein
MSVARSLAALLEQPSSDPATAKTLVELERMLRLVVESPPLALSPADFDKMTDSEVRAVDAALAAIERVRAGRHRVVKPEQEAEPEGS